MFLGYHAFVFCEFLKTGALNGGVFPQSDGVSEAPVFQVMLGSAVRQMLLHTTWVMSRGLIPPDSC